MGNNKKVMIGMSGGVDSSVAALLLKKQGYDVTGVTFRLWSPDVEDDAPLSGCCSIDDVNDARKVCHQLDIPHYVFNFKELFKEKVVDEFAASYAKGKTPNPCINCNKHIKFDAFIQKAKSMGFDYVATGHYAYIEHDEKESTTRLRSGQYSNKDQSYVLYCITKEQLPYMLMPLGDYSKDEVRNIAEENGLVVYSKPDSQDICFVPDGDYAGFLKNYTGSEMPKGKFVSPFGDVLGEHKGINYYTIGQRKGLGISFGTPMFVTKIDAESNTVTLGSNEALLQNELTAKNVNWIERPEGPGPFNITAKIRYAHKASPATVYIDGDFAKVNFNEAQRAVTPGQAVVFYNGEYVIGGGTII